MKIRELLNLRQRDGDIGVEIEVEASNNLPGNARIPTIWRCVSDGSLRGSAAEYVFREPIKAYKINRAIEGLKKAFKDYGTNLKHSFRAGVHVHVNVLEMTLDEVINFACVYYCLESVLMNFCGESRKGNHFCLRAKDAEYPVYLLHQAAMNGDISVFQSESLKYAAINFNALGRFGSLEFRAMETQPELSKIVDWVYILMSIRKFSKELTNRREIAFQISYLGPENWVKKVLGDAYYDMLNYPELSQNLMQDMRRVQAVLYTEEKPSNKEGETNQTRQDSPQTVVDPNREVIIPEDVILEMAERVPMPDQPVF